ncbi:ATP-dependent DNA ligase [Hungatella hathewayi]|uniref:ATP-dependent DNA ligase n=1 Tax=Hungatella hathewayi TaxID=154046 RepID=UPI0035683283
MLIAEMMEPFDSDKYIYELKFDGIRCLAYIDQGSVDLRKKKDFTLLPRFPELKAIYKNVKYKCILDGELAIMINGVPDFHTVQRRSVLTDPFKIDIASTKYAATFVAFDIIYFNGELVNDKPLIARKKLLEQCFAKENNLIMLSRYIDEYGVQLFEMAKQQQLEGVVAKRKESLYWFGKESKDWIKIKVMKDEDFVLCGYILKPNNMTSFIIGQYNGTKLVYKGHITLGASLRKLNQYEYTVTDYSPFEHAPPGNEKAVWLEPELVCTVEYMPDESIERRQATLKSIRDDKLPIECQVKD